MSSIYFPGFLVLTLGIFSWLDHKGQQGVANLAGTVVLGGVATIGIFLISRPIYMIHEQLLRYKFDALERITAANRSIEKTLANLDPISESTMKDVEVRWPTIELAKHIESSSTWPVPGFFGLPLLAGLAGPFLGSVVLSLFSMVQWLTSIT